MSDLVSRARRLWQDKLSPWVGLRDGPIVDPDGRTSVRGLFIAGDLADTPILKGALQHGWDVGLTVHGDLPPTAEDPDLLDVLVVGAGPAGCAAALALQQSGRRVVVLERERPFATLAAFPRGKMLYAEPRGLTPDPPFWFEDTTKEELVERWRQTIVEHGLTVHEGVALQGLERVGDAFEVKASRTGLDGPHQPRILRARRVVLAIGRRGSPACLDVPGEDHAEVFHHLEDASQWSGKRVLVVGGGDSAVEAALQLADEGARVVWSYRRPELKRPKRKNRDRARAAIREGRVDFRGGTRVSSLANGHAIMGDDSVPYDAAFVLIGTLPPHELLRHLGLPLGSDSSMSHKTGLVAFAAFVWCFYVLKTGRRWFPFHESGLAWAHDALKLEVTWWPGSDGGRVLDAGFWGTVLYSLAILGFGLAAMRRHPTPTQRRRYLSLIGFQWLFLFGIPEVLAPMVTSVSGAAYSLSVPWPLRIESLAYGPAAGGWMAVGAFTSFVLVPAFVRRHNERFCSWMCGCGGLAETVGDVWRWRAPRGDGARAAEGLGRLVFLAAIPVTLLVIADAWQLVGFNQWIEQEVHVVDGRVDLGPGTTEEREGVMRVASASVVDGALRIEIEKFDWDGVWRRNGWLSGLEQDGRMLYPDKVEEGVYSLPLAHAEATFVAAASSSALSRPRDFARAWYGLVVDFFLASVIGVALYPMLGNRVWCRFFCPLRAYMEWIAARVGRLTIRSDDTCISCGECTTNCQMGIDVQGFAEDQVLLDNRNSACIQCGVCVEVCPMEVLTLVDRVDAGLPRGPLKPEGPRWGV